VIDNTAGGNTQLNAAGNGVPVIDIATPSRHGLSHNQFREYNVGSEGLILNNSTQKLQSTELGGYIQGNPNLNGRAAQVILNEVTGSNRSALKGYTEVAGSAAQVIVANPHGITCDGCGFINTPKATLTTGTPIIKDGQLKQYDVDGGDILMEGTGIDARNIDAFELITRSARINAALHANHLSIVAGRNQVDADTLQATAKADDGSLKPLLAIDSSALGGMYAGAITLVGTEDGVGVKLSGDMAANSADIEIDANGKLTVTRSASGRDMRLNAQQVSLKDEHYAAGEVKITTAVLEVDKALASGGDMRLSAERLDNHGVLEAGIRSDGRANEKAQLRVESRALNNYGEILSHGDMQLQAANIDNHTGRIKAGAHVQLSADRLNNQSGQVFAEKALNIDIKQTDNRQGQLLAEGNIALKGHGLDNQQGTLVTRDSAQIRLTDPLNNTEGLLEAGNSIELQTKQVNNTNGKLRALGNSGHSEFVIGARLINDNGKIEVTNSIFNLTAETFNQNADGQILALGELQLAGNQWNNQGQIRTGGALTLNLSGELHNQGLFASEHAMDLSASRLINQQGLIYSLGDLTLKAQGLINQQGELYTQGALSFIQDAQGHRPLSFTNLSGTVESGAELSIAAEQIDNVHVVDNLIESRKIGAVFYNPGCTDCSGDKENVTWQLREIDRTFAHSDLPGASLLSGSHLYLQGQAIRNDYSKIAAAGHVHIQAERFISRGAIIGDTQLERFVQSDRLKARDLMLLKAYVNDFNSRHWPLPDNIDNKADISAELNGLLGNFPIIEWRRSSVITDAAQPYQAQVLAGGNVLIEAQQMGNASIEPSFNYVSGGRKADGAIGTQITPSDISHTLQNQRIDLASNTRLPTSAQGLFIPSSGSRYLIETNPALASLRGYLNSDYLLRQLGYDPDTAQRRLGDGLYEQRLIRSALMSHNGYDLTGSDEAPFKQLMDNGIAAAQRLQLRPGIALSAEQVAALTHDMVWLEEREVGGEKVLAPVLYLAQGSTGAAGSVIRGNDIRLLSETLENSGTLAASGSLQVFAG